MEPSVIYCDKCGKVLGLVMGPGAAKCPGCGRTIEAKPIEERQAIGAAG